MDKIRVFSCARIYLGSSAILHIEESTDGNFDIEIQHGISNVRLCVPLDDGGKYFKFAKDVLK